MTFSRGQRCKRVCEAERSYCRKERTDYSNSSSSFVSPSKAADNNNNNKNKGRLKMFRKLENRSQQNMKINQVTEGSVGRHMTEFLNSLLNTKGAIKIWCCIQTPHQRSFSNGPIYEVPHRNLKGTLGQRRR